MRAGGPPKPDAADARPLPGDRAERRPDGRGGDEAWLKKRIKLD